MSAEEFVAAAQRATGLLDFGGDGFRAGLRVLVDDLEHSHLSPALATAVRGLIAQNLEKRLKLVGRRRLTPAIADEKIDRPVFVIGLPRTGTTALVDLLAQDPAVRSPLQWETAHLVELSDPSSWQSDSRIDALQALLDAASRSNPIVALGLHTYGARLPDECNTFMTMNFWSPNLAVAGHLPRYSDWLRFATPPQRYRLHKWVLQHLQHFGRGGRWTLKSPFHAFDLPGILAEYPNAVFVQTHRNPVQLMASMCGLYATIRGEGPADPRRAQTGLELVRLWGTGMQRAMAARRDPDLDARVMDLSHRELLASPLGAVRRVYERFGFRLSAEAETRMRRWIDAPAQHVSSVKFTLAEFGLDEAGVDAAFGRYRDRFSALF